MRVSWKVCILHYTVSNLIALCLFSLGMIKALYDMDFVVIVLAGIELASLK